MLPCSGSSLMLIQNHFGAHHTAQNISSLSPTSWDFEHCSGPVVRAWLESTDTKVQSWISSLVVIHTLWNLVDRYYYMNRNKEIKTTIGLFCWKPNAAPQKKKKKRPYITFSSFFFFFFSLLKRFNFYVSILPTILFLLVFCCFCCWWFFFVCVCVCVCVCVLYPSERAINMWLLHDYKCVQTCIPTFFKSWWEHKPSKQK